MKQTNKIIAKHKKAKEPPLVKTTYGNLEKKIRQQTDELKISKGQLKQGADREKLGANREKLAEEQIYIRTKAMESTLDGIFIINAKKKNFPIIYANPSFHSLIGYTKSEVLGKDYFLFYGVNADLRVIEEIKQTMRQGRSFHGEMLNFKKNGEKFWSLLRIAPVRDTNGDITHYVGIQTDITLMKQRDLKIEDQREELLHVTRVGKLAEFVSSLAHEISQPLTAILSYAQAAQRMYAGREPQLQEILQYIVNDDQRAAEVIRRLRLLLKKNKPTFEPLDINVLIQDTAALIMPHITVKNKVIKFDLDRDLPFIQGDRIQLQQVLLNLISNSLEAMEEGDDSCELLISTLPKDGDTIMVKVKDSGCGIPKENMGKLFTHFFTNKPNGLGMGLPISRSIVEAHGGQLDAVNNPDREGVLVTGAELFVKCLENEGVRYIFGVPGEETEDILFALEKSSIQFIPTRHEQGAAFMADMWGRLSGQAGVCLSTLGPGATNLVTGVADANLDKSPLVAISAQAGLGRLHKASHQYVNLPLLFRPITKWNSTITTVDVIPEIVRKAFKTAESEKPGATHIEFPEDIAAMDVEGVQPMRRIQVRRPDPDTQALEEVVTLLKQARYPLIMAGNGTVRTQASEQLRTLAQQHNIPVVHTLMGQGALLDSNERSLFSIGLGFRDIVMDAMDMADVVLAVGYDIAEYAPQAWNPNQDKKIIHIDFTPADVYTHYQPVVEVVADIAMTLKELNKRLTENKFQHDGAWYKPVRERIIKDIASYTLKEGDAFTIPGVLNILQSIMQGDDLLISDVGSHKVWIARNFSACCANGRIISNGLASMGFALPGAVAAALHSPKRRIIAAMGDGGFMMNSQELETAQRLNLNFISIIFNDNDYGLISWKQQMSRGRSTGTKITNPDFKAYAQSFGIKGYHPHTLTDLKEQLTYAMEAQELSVFEISVDTAVNQELIKKLNRT